MLRLSLVTATLFVVVVGALSFLSACPPAKTTGEGEGEGRAGEGEGAAGEGEGEGAAGEGEGEGCGAVTTQGTCNGNVAEFCSGGTVHNDDCSAAPFIGLNAQCTTINNTFGVDCAVPQGSSCALSGGTHGLRTTFCQGGTTAACEITSATAATCVNSATSCGASDSGTCRGTVFVSDCAGILHGDTTSTNGQPVLIDCSQFAGSTCTPETGGGGGGAPTGGCLVAPGATCTPGTTVCGVAGSALADCPSAGTCPTGGEGEGEGEGEGGQ